MIVNLLAIFLNNAMQRVPQHLEPRSTCGVACNGSAKLINNCHHSYNMDVSSLIKNGHFCFLQDMLRCLSQL